MAIYLTPASLASGTLESWEYLSSYGDLINAFGPDSAKAANHYNTFGIAEGRAITFDAWAYLASYGDLMDAFGTNVINAAKHYVTYGYGEGRLVTFDAEAYLDNYADLRAAFGADTVAAEQHYVIFGRAEGRNDYTLDASASSVEEGDSVVFTLDTKDLAEGTEFDYSITGVNAADIDVALSGTMQVGADGKAILTVSVLEDGILNETESITFSVNDHQETVSIIDTSSYTLDASSNSISEGQSVTFTLTAEGSAVGSEFAYEITGVDAADIDIPLSGTAVVGADHRAVVTVNVLEDGLRDELETMHFAIAGQSKNVSITDTTYVALETITQNVTEGQTAEFLLSASSFPAGTEFDYHISGVSVDDIEGDTLNGVATIDASGNAVIKVPLVSDGIVDPETLKVTLIQYQDVYATANISDPTAYMLTVQPDVGPAGTGVEAETFIALPYTAPASNLTINTLQDEDILVGVGDNAVLNATIGNTLFDNTEESIAPTLIDVRTVNLNFNSGDVFGIGFASTTGVEVVNVNRVADNQGGVMLYNMQEETTTVGIRNAEIDNRFSLNWNEGELEGVEDELDLNLSNDIIGELTLSQGDFMDRDTYEDENFGWETVNVHVEEAGPANIDRFFLNKNQEEEDSYGTEQTLNFDVDSDLEINDLEANGVEHIGIDVAQDTDMVVARDEDNFGTGPSNDGIHTWDLQDMTIVSGVNGNVIIDGLNGAETGVDVDATGMQGDLWLGVREVTSDNAGTSIASGIGDDKIITYGDLAGDVSTDGGNDLLELKDYDMMSLPRTSGNGGGNPGPSWFYDGPADFEATADVDMGDGNDTVIGADMEATGDRKSQQVDADGNKGDYEEDRAYIDLGAGDDKASIHDMKSDEHWNDHATNDNDNSDDTYIVRGAELYGGDGNDTVNLYSMREQAIIDMGADSDDVIFDVSMYHRGGPEYPDSSDLKNDNVSPYAYGMRAVMEGDSADRREKVEWADDRTDPNNILGAQVYLGEGESNTITFNDTELFENESENGKEPEGGCFTHWQSMCCEEIPVFDCCQFVDSYGQEILLMGEGALVNAGDGVNDVFNVNFVNDVIVAANANWSSFNSSMPKMIEGIETINLTAQKVANPMDAFGATNDASIELDVFRVDESLQTINLVSEESVSPTDDYVSNEDHTPGNPVKFTLDNLREEIDVNLTAQEASGVINLPGYGNESGSWYDNGDLYDDGDIYASDFKPSPSDPANPQFVVVDQTDIWNQNYQNQIAGGNPQDEVYNVDYYMYNEIHDDSDIVDVYLEVNNDDNDASSHEDSFVLDVTEESGEFDLCLTVNGSDYAGGSTTGDDIDNLIEKVTINFADTGSHYINMDGFGDLQHKDGDPHTSLTINSNAVAGETITVVNTSAETIGFYGNSPIEANVNLMVIGQNDYSINTGNGNDILDMRFDNVNWDDMIDAGAGRDILVISGDDDLGQNDGALEAPYSLAPYPAENQATEIDDDVFGQPDLLTHEVHGLHNFEVITIDTDQGETSGPESGDQSGSGDYDPQRITLDGAATYYNAIDTINIIGSDNEYCATDHWLDLLIGNNFANAGHKLTIDAMMHYAGDTIQIDNHDLDEDEQYVDLDVRVNAESGTQLHFVNTGRDERQVDVTVLRSDETSTQIGESVGFAEGDVRITVEHHTGYDGGSFDVLTVLDNDTANGGNDTYIIADEWTDDSATAGDNQYDFKLDAHDVEMRSANISAEVGDEADYWILGTNGSAGDTIVGGAYDDSIEGNAGNDTITGDMSVGNDSVTWGEDTIDGGNGADYIYGDDGTLNDLDAGGDDVLNGNGGKDCIWGQGGDDTINGGAGDDTIYGGHGADLMAGGAGSDCFCYYDVDDSDGNINNLDHITDFSAAEDVFDFNWIANFGTVTFMGETEQGDDAESILTGGGDLEIVYALDDHKLYIDVDGDGDIDAGDMVIKVDVTGTLTQANFDGCTPCDCCPEFE